MQPFLIEGVVIRLDMLSRSLATPPRKNNKKMIKKLCPMCNTEFEILLWQQNGSAVDRNWGWHKRIYCDTCRPKREAMMSKTRRAKYYLKEKADKLDITK